MKSQGKLLAPKTEKTGREQHREAQFTWSGSPQLEIQCGWARELKMRRSSLRRHPHICEFYFHEPCQILASKMGEKASCHPGRRKRKVTILKYAHSTLFSSEAPCSISGNCGTRAWPTGFLLKLNPNPSREQEIPNSGSFQALTWKKRDTPLRFTDRLRRNRWTMEWCPLPTHHHVESAPV